tara:strand:+ start:1049 stop:2494 length:1446 start_codon:yes stop_codon:yes gene_type:complete
MAYIGNTPANIFTSLETQTITGDGSTEYTLTHAVSSGKDILVYINNVKQEEGSGKSYTATGSTITFSDAVASTDSCYLLYVNRAIGTHTPADASVDADAIAGGAVTTAKIAADAVTGAKIADDAIDSEHYTDGSIDTAHLGDLQVTTAKIAADAITGAKIADDAINSEHYTDGSIDTAHIADSQITSAKLGNNSVGITQLNVSDGSSGQFLRTDGSGTLSFATVSVGLTGIDDQSSSNDDQVTITDSAVVINEDSDDVDFRVESNGNANMLVVDGGVDQIAIGRAINSSSTVAIQNKDDSNQNCLDLFNDNGNRMITMQQDTSGNGKLILQNNDGTNRVRLDANNGGIAFGTDTAAANTLDDYEEGTWTPTGNGVTFTGNSGTYVKIGRVVYVNFVFTIPSNSSSNAFTVSGFPFSSSSSNATRGGFVTAFTNNDDVNKSNFLIMGTSSTTAAFNSQQGNAVTNNDFNNGGQIFKSGFYMV